MDLLDTAIDVLLVFFLFQLSLVVINRLGTVLLLYVNIWSSEIWDIHTSQQSSRHSSMVPKNAG